MKKSIAAVTSLGIIVFAGCASIFPTHSATSAREASWNRPPSTPRVETAEYGIAPGASREKDIRCAMSTLLQDSQFTPLRFLPPERSWLPRDLFEEATSGQPPKEGRVFGWKVHFFVPVQNGNGRVVAEKAYEAFFQEGHLRGILQELKNKDRYGYPTWGLLVSIPTPE